MKFLYVNVNMHFSPNMHAGKKKSHVHMQHLFLMNGGVTNLFSRDKICV